MPATTRIFFSQVAHGTWKDWIEIVNVGNDRTKLTAIARDQNGKAVWSTQKSINPFQCWVVPAEGVADKKGDVSLGITSNQPILGERHCHLGSQVLDFPGAAVKLDSAGTRLFFAEIASYIGDWLRFMNVGESDALITVVGHDRNTGQVVAQFSGKAPPLGFWTVGDAQVGEVTGTLEVISTQPIIGERHSHYAGGKSAVGQLGQIMEGRAPTPRNIYFSQIAPGDWKDWVTVTNVSNQRAKLTGIARDRNGKPVWSDDKTVNPFQCWMPPLDDATKNQQVSLEITSNQPVLGERHCHLQTQVLSFPGAASELGTVGRRLFFPELYSGANDWLMFLNVGEANALVTVVARDRNTAEIMAQFQANIKPLGHWIVPDSRIKNVTGTLEITSTQPIVGERHMHYKGGKTAVSQLGQVIEL